jgi:hypothetical protein
MSKTPNADAVNPKIKVTSNVDKAYQQTTAGTQTKSEEHYRKIVDRAINRDGESNG